MFEGAAPGVTERISYDIPTFDLDGALLTYVAGWRAHVSLYPVPAGVAAAFADELAPYRSGAGTLRFPLHVPLPADLIGRMLAFRAAEIAG